MRLALSFGLLFLIAFPMAAVAGQAEAEPSGVLTIVVENAEASAIPGAKLKAVRIRDQKTIEGQSDSQGRWEAHLPIGTYGLTVRATGFKPDFIGGVNVRAQSSFPLKFRLFPGDSTEKLLHERTPEEHAKALAAAQLPKEEKLGATPQKVMDVTWAKLDEACAVCKIQRTNGGPMARAILTREGLEQFKQGRFPEALERFRQALGEDATDPLTWFNCGVLFNRQQMSKPAETAFRTAIGLCGGGGDPLYHSYLGRALAAQGRIKEAEPCFRAAILLDPAHEGDFLYELGCGYHSLKLFPEATRLFEEAIRKKCSEAYVHFGYANALEMLRKDPEALAQYRLFIERAKADPQLAGALKDAQRRIERLTTKPPPSGETKE